MAEATCNGDEGPARILSPGQELLLHVQSSQPACSSPMPTLSSALATGSLHPASRPAVPEVLMLPGWDLQARGEGSVNDGFVAVLHLQRACPRHSQSALVCQGLGSFPFPPRPWETCPASSCLPRHWGETRLSGGTRVLASADGSALGQHREADDGAHFPPRQPVKMQASI